MRYVSLVSAFLAVFAYGSAQATQITNADDEGYAVIVVTTAGEKITKVAAGEI
ncbi:MAG: hypothetical protein H8E36_00405, partial [Rhodospirillaceae bacterium]|nr:hypothetical protein [Rhodospirillaceae bacterium]